MTSLISKQLRKLLVGYGQASKVVFAARVPGTILSTSLSVNFSVFFCRADLRSPLRRPSPLVSQIYAAGLR